MSVRVRQLLDMKGRTALVTGAGGILGPHFCAALAEFGARVAFVDVDAAACKAAARAIGEEFQVETLALPADVSSEASVRASVDTLIGRWGRIDVLVNGAACRTPGYYEPLLDYALADWSRVLDVSLTGTFLCSKHVAVHMKAAGAGSIINIGSIYGVVGPDPGLYEGSSWNDRPINTPPVYAAAKGAVVNLTRYLATTLAPFGVRANAISPGGVYSGQNGTFVARYGERTPLGRMARAEELRGAVAFLASDASSYVTGHNLVVDGGWTAR